MVSRRSARLKARRPAPVAVDTVPIIDDGIAQSRQVDQRRTRSAAKRLEEATRSFVKAVTPKKRKEVKVRVSVSRAVQTDKPSPVQGDGDEELSRTQEGIDENSSADISGVRDVAASEASDLVDSFISI